MIGTQDCDVTLKALIAGTGDDVLDYLAGTGKVAAWLNVEMPRVRNPRVDLLARLESGGLAHVELQRGNDMTPQRMLEYGVEIWQREGMFPQQYLLYAGNEPCRMTGRFDAAGLQYRFQVIDLRLLDGDAMAASESLALNILSILGGSHDSRQLIRRVMMKLKRLEPAKRADAIHKFLIVAGLRKLAAEVNEEGEQQMPIVYDMMEHEVFGPLIRQGLEKGREEGREEGLEEGLEKGRSIEAKRFLRVLLEKRFGSLPGWVEEKLGNCTAEDAEAYASRFLDAGSLKELFATDLGTREHANRLRDDGARGVRTDT